MVTTTTVTAIPKKQAAGSYFSIKEDEPPGRANMVWFGCEMPRDIHYNPFFRPPTVQFIHAARPPIIVLLLRKDHHFTRSVSHRSAKTPVPASCFVAFFSVFPDSQCFCDLAGKPLI